MLVFSKEQTIPAKIYFYSGNTKELTENNMNNRSLSGSQTTTHKNQSPAKRLQIS